MLKTWPGHFGSTLEHRPALNVDVVFLCFLLQTFGVLVRNLDRKLLDQFRSSLEDRRRVRKLRKYDQSHRQKRRRARDCRINHRKHAIRVRAHPAPIDRIRKIRLASSY